MPAPPSFQKVNPADQPVMFLVLRSATLPLSTVNEYAETTIAQRISMVSGVAQVQVFGAARYAVRVDVDPRQLAAYGIGIDEVATAIANANVNLPTGTIYGAEQTVHGAGQRPAAHGGRVRSDDRRLPQRQPGAARRGRARLRRDRERQDGGLVPRRARAHARDPEAAGHQRRRRRRRGQEAAADLPRTAAGLGARSTSAPIAPDPIRESVHDVKLTLLLTVGLVVLVIFLFLRNVSATIIPSLALPASIVATFAVMYLLDYSLDNLSLMALTLAVGFVVDDAIVMLENIVRHMEMGKAPMRAALDGSQEVGVHDRVDDGCRWSPSSSRCCSWAASSAGCCTSSP